MKISYHEQLDTTKRQIAVPVPLQDSIYSIKQISPYHTDFINNQQIKAFDNLLFLFTESEHSLPARFMGMASREKRSKRKLEKGVKRNTSGINGSNSCWSSYNHSFDAVFAQIAQECGFAGACLTCQKNMIISILNKIPCCLKLMVFIIFCKRISHEIIYRTRAL